MIFLWVKIKKQKNNRENHTKGQHNNVRERIGTERGWNGKGVRWSWTNNLLHYNVCIYRKLSTTTETARTRTVKMELVYESLWMLLRSIYPKSNWNMNWWTWHVGIFLSWNLHASCQGGCIGNEEKSKIFISNLLLFLLYLQFSSFSWHNH